MAVIEAEGLTKVYKAFRKRFTAVDNVSFDIEQGDVFGFLGPNGAGKTTTIRMLTGVVRPTRGTARICGYDITEQSFDAKKRIGLMPESLGFYEFLKGIELLRYYAEFFKLSPAERKRKATELMALVGLNGVAHDKVSTYSHGMRKRLALASALIHEPEVLVLDEPTAGLDPIARRAFSELVRELNGRGITVLLSSHMLGEVQALCNRVGIIKAGNIIALDATSKLADKLKAKLKTHIDIEAALPESVADELAELPGVEAIATLAAGVRLTVIGYELITPQITRLLVERDVAVRAISYTEPGLEDIFIALAGASDDAAT